MGKSSVMVPSEIMVNGQIVGVFKTVHLGHTVWTTDCVYVTLAMKNSFCKTLNMLIANFGQLYCCINVKLFSQFCCSFLGP